MTLLESVNLIDYESCLLAGPPSNSEPLSGVVILNQVE